MSATAPIASDEELLVVANGVNAVTGRYLLPALKQQTVCELAEHKPLDSAELAELRAIYGAAGERYLGVGFGVDPNDLMQAGWGVVFPKDASPEIREALQPLLEHRAAQAGALYKELSGSAGYRAGESARDFLARSGAAPGPAVPTKLPYYLLLVGDPRAIPFELQHGLDVARAVGRISFDTVEQYATYARAVVAAESHPAARGRTVGFFAPRHPGDIATHRSSKLLVGTLADRLRVRHADWTLEAHVGEQATKEQLAGMLGGKDAPAFLFTATHGLGFPCGHERQRAHQGALLCQGWPGPLDGPTGIAREQYFAADDVPVDASPGRIAFLFACFGAGTPEWDAFAPRELAAEARIAPAPFVAALPQRMLVRGALAVVGHVDRAWGCSFLWKRAGVQVDVFQWMIESVMAGQPLGAAMEYVNQRYAEISTELTEALDDRHIGVQNDADVAELWTANNDARNYVILGDPAVRLACG